MKIVGLKIEQGRVAASVVEKGLRRTELASSFSLTFASDGELADILREKAHEWSGAHIVSSIPGARFSQRTVTFPFADRKRVEKALPFELEDNIPFPLDDIAIDHLALERPGTTAEKKKEHEIVGIMVPKLALRQHLEFLASAGLDPQAVVPSYAGLLCVARRIPTEGIAAVIDGSDICLKDGGAVLSCRSFSASRASGGIHHTIKALEAGHVVQVERAYLLSEDGALSVELAELGIAVEREDFDLNGKKADDAGSLGLALCEETNFRKGEFAYRRAETGLRKQRRAIIAAAAIAAVLAAANLCLKYYLVESSYGKLDREIKEIYRQTFPEAKTVADPVRQLRARLDEAQKKFGVLGSGSSALDIMKAVTDGIPKEVSVFFQEFNLEGDRLKLAGDAPSFESVDKIKAELQKAEPFSEIQVLDTRMGVDNKVKFRFEMKLKKSM
ncbi:MAG TPA: type II secretion system protein GspL [Nitrospirota bacterium]